MFPKRPGEGTRETKEVASHSDHSGTVAVLYRVESLVRLIPVLEAEQDAGHAWRLARIRLDVTADAHRLFQLGALGTGLGFQRCP